MISHKEAFKKAAANWQQCKSASIAPPDGASAASDCQRQPKTVVDSPDDSDDSNEMEKENLGAQRQAQRFYRFRPSPYNLFMKRGKIKSLRFSIIAT